MDKEKFKEVYGREQSELTFNIPKAFYDYKAQIEEAKRKKALRRQVILDNFLTVFWILVTISMNENNNN